GAALAVADLDPRPGLQLLRVAVAQLAVVLVPGDVEVDVAAGGVGVAPGDQPPHDLDHVGDVLGRLGHAVDAGDVELLQAVQVVGRHGVGEVLDRGAQLAGADDQLVVDVGDVDDEGDLVAEVGQEALDGVEDDRPDHVADVAGLVDGGAADVHADLAGAAGAEL